jgi:hypothetical protein
MYFHITMLSTELSTLTNPDFEFTFGAKEICDYLEY